MEKILTEEYKTGGEEESQCYWTVEEYHEAVLSLKDSEGKGTVTEQFNTVECDEETIKEKLYGKESFWRLGDYYRWNSLERIESWGSSLFTTIKTSGNGINDSGDKPVFLGEYPLEESIGNQGVKRALLYGVQKEAPDRVILLLGNEYEQIYWYWGNNYQVYPELVCKDVDQDGEGEISLEYSSVREES